MQSKTLAVTLVMAAALFGVTTVHASNEVYFGAGTTGITGGYAKSLGERSGVRVEANYLNYSRNFNTSDAKYDGTLKFTDVGAYYDVFFAGPFRLSAGLMIGTHKLEADGQASSGTITINHQQYDATGEWVRAQAKYATVRPYLGLGWGHRPERSGLGFFGDVGVAYGSPSVSFRTSPGLQVAAGSANIEAERENVQSKADNLRFYPVVRVGLDYTF
ncbi:MAG: hypothetical protein EPN61_18135 [Burkholderiaceae bacterium]|nr:MAG: hypothetical protein EPN61_18135 [Burkholderiaceae bacterium]